MFSFRFSLLIFVVLTACLETTKIQWPFYTTDMYFGVVNVTIGTPGQFVQLLFSRESFNANLQVPSTNVKNGVYNPNISSTFQQTGDITDQFYGYLGQVGTDTFVIGDGVVEKSEPFRVYDALWFYNSYGVLGLGHSGTSNFIESVINTLDEPVVVFTYDQIPYADDEPVSGTITLGGKPTECSNTWTRVNEHVFDAETLEQWAVEIDKISAGKFIFRDPGQALISFTEASLSFPETTFDSFVEALDVRHDNTIDCNAQKTITYTIGGLDIVLGPQDYIRHDKKDHSTCYFGGGSRFGDDNYRLPVSILKDRCLLLDYQRIEIGFADRVKN